MSGECKIEGADNLVTIPRPLDAEHGKVLTSVVHSHSASRKRKRFEVVVAADGDSVNIYNVRSSRLVVSHAIPPQAFLTAPPSSVLQKASSGAFVRRTYVATRNDLAKRHFQITCYTHYPVSADIADPSPTGDQRCEIGGARDEVIYVDTICRSPADISPGESSYDVLVVQARGAITCISADLSQVRWTSSIQGLAEGQSSIHFAAVVPLAEAILGLQKVETFAPVLPAIASASENSYVLYVLSESDQSRSELQALLINTDSTSSTSRSAHLRSVCSWNLKTLVFQKHTLSSGSSFALDAGAATLSCISEHELVRYNLTNLNPQPQDRILETQGTITSFLPLSQGLTILSNEQFCSVLDTHYQSRQASFIFPATSTNIGQKRTRVATDVTSRGLRLGHYFPSLHLVVGVSTRSLIGIYVTTPRPLSKRRLGHSRLIDSLGRGLGNPINQIPHLSTISEKLESYATAKDVENFEKNFFELVDINGDRHTSDVILDPLDETKAADTDFGKQSDNSSFNTHPAQLDCNLAKFALSKIFRIVSNPSSSFNRHNRPTSLEVAFFPPKVFFWLIDRCFLTAADIRSAFSQYPLTHGSASSITSSDLVNALANQDRSLNLLWKYMLNSGTLDLPGTVTALQIFLESLETQKPSSVDPSHLLTNGENDLEQQLRLEEEAAAQELNAAMSSLRDGLSIRAVALRTCLATIPIAYSSTQIVKALRAQLSPRQLVLLIDLLRFELAEGGWTTRYIDMEPVTNAAESSKDEAITIICTLLNCSLDALGTGSWLTGLTSYKVSGSASAAADEADTLITFLRAETSATLEGIQESSFFKGFLKDFFRYEQTISKAQKNSHTRSNKYKRRLSETGVAIERADVVLPMGLKTAQRIPETRVGAGGEMQKRSRRDIGHQLNRRVGMYTFETIRL